jgi:hypothetical protein
MNDTARALILYFWCLLFPVGIWLATEGYEIAAMISLILGWAPAALFITVKLLQGPGEASDA